MDIGLRLIKEVGVRLFILDLNKSQFVDSSGLGSLLSMHKTTSLVEGLCALANVQRRVQSMFELTRLHRVFKIFSNIETAIKGLSDWRENVPRKEAPDYIADLRNKDSGIRVVAVQALRVIAENWPQSGEAWKQVPDFITALEDQNAGVRRAAAEALGAVKDLRAVQPLVTALEDKDAGVRRAAAEALGAIKDLRAVEPLVTTLEDEDEDVRRAAAEALRAIK
jgi:anti-anti-sigma regulatory factor